VAQVPDGSFFFQMAGGMPVVTAPAEIDVTTAGQLRAMLAAWATRGHTTVVVDMTGTQFCDSSGLTVLVRAHKQALAEGGELRVVLPASGPVLRIFTLTGLDGVIAHFTGLEQALAQVPDGRVRPRGPRPSPGMRSRAERNSPGPGGSEEYLQRIARSPALPPRARPRGC
jgi:anti-sigma B factor antagonist